MTFENLNLIAPILQALKAQGYDKPTPIQEQAIPLLLQGRDLLGCAQTGTGKTCAFTVPILQLMAQRQEGNGKNRKVKALIVTPTRELALQIDESIRDYGKHLNLRHTVIFGGVKQGAQTHILQKGIDILTATPGRLLDLMDQGFISLRDIEFFVLDEADRMLDMGFIHDVKRIIAKLPNERQSLYFSATMPKEIVELSEKVLKNPAKVTIKPETTTAERVDQAIYYVDKGNKNALLLHLLKNPEISRVLIFSRTKHGANKIAKVLNRAGIGAEPIHGNKSQAARVKALDGFKAGKIRALVATDIAARGIDIDELSHVVQFDLPNVAETYVHRIGRTGRAGASGIAVSFCDREERPYLRDIQRLIRQDIEVVEDHPYLPGTRVERDANIVAAESAVENARGNRGGFASRREGNKNQSGRNDKAQNNGPRRNSNSAPNNSNPRPQGEGRQESSETIKSGDPRKRSRNRNRNRNRSRNGNPNGSEQSSKGQSRSGGENKNSGNDQAGNRGFRGGISWD